ncbi:MAG: 4'-phosphopantetheinyl transferase family protein [Pirellulales bacterium]
MIDCPAPTNRFPTGIDRQIAIAGCRIDVSIDRAADAAHASGEAARRAEDLIAAQVGCERRMVRVAALMPSGRPVAMVRGRVATASVSVSHSGSLIATAVCASASVGIDVVDPAEAGRSLDVWFTPDELALLPDEDGLLRARLWGAKEAAFKAAGLDDGFRPRSVDIVDLGRTGFRWRVRGDHRPVCGQGVFTFAGMCLVAIAVAAKTLDTADVPTASCHAEVVACS